MPTEKRSLPPRVDSQLQQVRDAFRRELHQQRHRMREVEEAVGKSQGYFYKFPAGAASMTIDLMLHALAELDVDADRFFATALGAEASSETLLEALESLGPIDRRLVELERAARQLELREPGPETASAEDADALVASTAGCSGVEQRRRLSTAKRYRSHAFAAGYLDYLDALRYDDPRQAVLSARTLALKLLPRLGGPKRGLIELQATALGVFGSAHRQIGGFATAARAVRLALALARRHRLSLATARLLQRGAYVLSDHGRFDQAMKLLDEALLIFVDRDDQVGLGRVLINRGVMFNYLGSYRRAVRSLTKGIGHVTELSTDLPRLRKAAYHALGFAYESLGDLDRAEEALRQALEISADTGEIDRAKLLWFHASISSKRGNFATSEQLLRAAKELLDRSGSAEKALVALDLTKALLAQDKSSEALEVVASTLKYLEGFGGNRVARAAVSSFIQAALEGSLSVARIEEFQRVLKSIGSEPPPGHRARTST